MRAFASGFALLAAGVAVADEGEIDVAANVRAEVAYRLRHPLAHGSPAQSLPTPVARAGANARLGLTNDLSAGFGLEAGGTSNVSTDGVSLGDTTVRVITGAYYELAAPAEIRWRLDSGYDVSAVASFEVGPLVTAWCTSVAGDASRVDDAGRALRLPIAIEDAGSVGIEARLTALFEARIWNNFALRLGPYVTASWAGEPTLRIGLVFEPSWFATPTPR